MRKILIIAVSLMCVSCYSNIDIKEISKNEFNELKDNYSNLLDTTLPSSVQLIDTIAHTSYGAIEKGTNICITPTDNNRPIIHFKFATEDDLVNRNYEYIGSINNHYMVKYSSNIDAWNYLIDAHTGKVTKLTGENNLILKNGNIISSEWLTVQGDRKDYFELELFEYINGSYIASISMQLREWYIVSFKQVSNEIIALQLENLHGNSIGDKAKYYIVSLSYIDKMLR